MLSTVITPQTRDLGDGFKVRRSLPVEERRMVGPFVFFDQMGPVAFPRGEGLAVRPHPHIGLATVTYLMEGEVMHRDSLGTVQPIRPGEVNWMTAGRGIVHSERTPGELQASGTRLAGIQIWVALPEEHEEVEPSFVHATADVLPVLQNDGCSRRLIVGELDGMRSPVPTFSFMFYVDAVLEPGASLTLSPEHEERAAYVYEGVVEFDSARYGDGQMLVFHSGSALVIRASTKARILLFGGAPIGPRHIWWNFVSSRKERIEQAAQDWQAGRFPPVPGETEFIPLPERLRRSVVNYP